VTSHVSHILGKIADGGFFCAGDFAAVNGFLTRNEAENRGLSGTIGTDQSGSRAGGNLKTGPQKKDLGTILFGYIGKVNHAASQEKVLHWYHSPAGGGKAIDAKIYF
jgi:hypothetical protein